MGGVKRYLNVILANLTKAGSRGKWSLPKPYDTQVGLHQNAYDYSSDVPSTDMDVEGINDMLGGVSNPFSGHLAKRPILSGTELLTPRPHPPKHRIPFPIIAAIYLLVAAFAYGASVTQLAERHCKAEDEPLTDWVFHARSRFVPARPIDPHLQHRFLELFSGVRHDEDDSEEFSDIHEASFAGDLHHINLMCPKQAFFFSLSQRHIEAHTTLKRLFLAQNSPEEVISLAKYLLVKNKVHPKVWYIALLQAKLDRQDMSGINLAHPLDAIPDWYVLGDLIYERLWKYKRSGSRGKRSTIASSDIRNTTSTAAPLSRKHENVKSKLDDNHDHHHQQKHKRRRKKGKRSKWDCITVDGRVGVDNGIENELWYWREDLMLNQHHWYWHQTHPPNSTQHEDRRAELFFYMHRAFVARYNAERLSNGMATVRPLQMRPGVIVHDGYNSHIADINSGIYWTPRPPDTPLQDVLHDNDPDFRQNITFRRLVTGIRTGRLLSEWGRYIPINHHEGILPLSNTIEASDLSVNPMYYDSSGIHTIGHLLVALAVDPDFRHRRVTGIMSESALSMRDPSFYTYHEYIDNLYEYHKQQLAPYRLVGGDFPLLWQGVEILSVELHSQGGAPQNELRTFWTHHNFELNPGVDGSIGKLKHAKVCAQHLDHEPFYFKLVIDRKPCVNSMSGQATVRMFMAPRYDEKGRRIPVKIQRRLMFPLDSFPVKLKVGRNTIIRHAEDSTLTQPWTKSLRELWWGPDHSGSAEFCGCGWPQHLYIPKGIPDGMPFDLFVMVTNEPEVLKVPETCHSPYIFCGPGFSRRYPDKKPMGYPFDRPLSKSLNCLPLSSSIFSALCNAINTVLYRPFHTLEQYVAKVPNMAMLPFRIKHSDIFLPESPGH